MKKLAGLLLLCTMSTGTLAAVSPDDEGGMKVGVDLLAIPDTTWAKVVDWASKNKLKATLAVVAVVAADRVSYNNDWLWYQNRANDKPVHQDPMVLGASFTPGGGEGGPAYNIYVNNSPGTYNIYIVGGRPDGCD